MLNGHVARSNSGTLAASTIVSFARQAGYSQGAGSSKQPPTFSAQLGATSPCLPAAVNLSATVPEESICQLPALGPTFGTQRSTLSKWLSKL